MAIIIDPPNSVWPNGLKVDSEGYVTFYPLGTNKVDINTVDWPVGDELVSPFVYQNSKLVGFCDTQAMTVSSNTSISLPYTHIEADFSSIEEGKLTVDAPNAIVKKFKWATETTIILGTKYLGCTNFSDLRAVEPNFWSHTDIVDGVWNESLKDLTAGTDDPARELFTQCTALVVFNSDLSSLGKGRGMFDDCSNLTVFNAKLTSLWDGRNMFRNCSNLVEFDIEVSSLRDGANMFDNCTNLTTFKSKLPSLFLGHGMFDGCKLNSASIKNIANTINPAAGGTNITLGMGCDNNEEDIALFMQEIGYSSINEFGLDMDNKGWWILVQYNGRPSSSYSIKRSSSNSLPVFVKLAETEEYADYTSLEESKKYKLDWFHETTGSTDGYTQFNSLEEAIETLNIKPIERN